MELQPFQYRVVKFKSGIDVKLNRLMTFIQSQEFLSVESDERKRLLRQHDLMGQLSSVLGERIAAFSPYVNMHAGLGNIPSDYNDALRGEAQRLREGWIESINRRVVIEQMMFDAARGKRPMPTAEELREWALKLGTAKGGPDA